MKGLFSMQKSKKISTVIKNVIGSEDTLMHSNYFSKIFIHYQAEQMKKGVNFVQILLEIHQTDHSTVHF